jgi:hypothetical protein
MRIESNFKNSVVIRAFRTLVIVSLVLFFQSCDDKEDDPAPDLCNEGRNGERTLYMKMIHHTRPIKGARVFIKYNATEFPGTDTTRYDYAVSAAVDSPIASIDSLACGNYYVYAIGIDSLLDPSNWICKGGLPYSTNLSSGIDSINVYITEGD